MLNRGDRVRWIECGMPGRVLEVLRGDYLIQWEPGYNQEVSGDTYWTPGDWIGKVIEPEAREMPEPVVLKADLRDAFEVAYRMSFEV